MMYKSPIEIITNDIQYEVVVEYEKQLIKAIQSYDIKVNKEELIKALKYDRQQYEKGYMDAEPKMGKWIENSNGTWSCNQCHSWIPEEQHFYANYCLYCGADMRGMRKNDSNNQNNNNL